MIIEQICSLIGFLREMINLNSDSGHLEDNFLNDIILKKCLKKLPSFK